MVARAAAAGAVAGLVVAALAAFLANAMRCIDTPAFYEPRALVWAGLGTGAIVTGWVLLGAGRARVALPVLLIGLALASYAIVTPPYKACGQFFVPG